MREKTLFLAIWDKMTQNTTTHINGPLCHIQHNNNLLLWKTQLRNGFQAKKKY